MSSTLSNAPSPATTSSLVRKGFYDGLTFHRIIKGFMVQGGDPLGNGTGGPGYTIKGEFAQNGVDNPLKHEERGVLSMARSMDPDSAGSQFFLMTDPAPHLDGQYAAFGKAAGEESFQAIDHIVNTPTPRSIAMRAATSVPSRTRRATSSASIRATRTCP